MTVADTVTKKRGRNPRHRIVLLDQFMAIMWAIEATIASEVGSIVLLSAVLADVIRLLRHNLVRPMWVIKATIASEVGIALRRPTKFANIIHFGFLR